MGWDLGAVLVVPGLQSVQGCEQGTPEISEPVGGWRRNYGPVVFSGDYFVADELVQGVAEHLVGDSAVDPGVEVFVPHRTVSFGERSENGRCPSVAY